MAYDFDRTINRYQTASLKWDEADRLFGSSGILPMWVADMDFRVPRPVIEAIKRRAEHGIFGYTTRPASYYDAVIGWMKRRHNWEIRKEWICHSPGVVPALSLMVQAFTQPGEKILIQPPVYYPFASVVLKNERELVYNRLVEDGGTYRMDFMDLERKLSDGVKMLILCSPHNPVGRVWRKDELEQLGRLCLEYGVLVVSDEIHADLVYSGHRHIPFAVLSEEFAQNSVICTAPSKTFNLAGLQTSNIIIPNETLRKTFTRIIDKNVLGLTNTFGVVATESAYREGDEWLDQCLAYLEDNLTFLIRFVDSRIPMMRVIKPEGTYLVWLDCRSLGLEGKELQHLLRKKAKVALDDGSIFGPGGEGFVRINIACSRSVLEEGLHRIERALKG
jgi:cystathionine beta-lyase